MRKTWVAGIVLIGLASWAAHAQDVKTVLENAAKTMGAANLKSIRYAGSGAQFNVGQSVNPNGPWPKFNLKSYTRVVNYDTVSSREEIVRALEVTPPAADQRLTWVVSGQSAWNVAGDKPTPAPATAEERLIQLWVTPHGVLKAAAAGKATAKSAKAGGRKVTIVSFTARDKYKVKATINDQNLVEKVETWIANPVMGDMPIETTYSDYKDFDGVKFPAKVVQKTGGFPSLELDVSEVRPNAPAEIQTPDNVRGAAPPAVKVEAQKLAEGVWYLAGGSHHSVAVEFKDHVAVIEGPLNEERSSAVIAEVKKTIPNKPIRYLVNTHHHFDHSGGIRTYAAEGATVLTHQVNKPFYERVFRAPRTLSPDLLSRSGKKARIEGLGAKRVLTDGSQTLELHLIQGSPHNDGILMAYLPKEKLLVEVDVFTPPAPNAPPPATPNPPSVNLYENIERLKLAVDRIVPLHGRIVPLGDLKKAIGQ